MKKRTRGRKLLIATAGLATVMYVACKEQQQPPGNLVAPPPTEHPPGNLPAPPPLPEEPKDAGAEDAGDATTDVTGTPNPNATGTPTTTATIATDPHKPPKEMPPGNLVAPPPVDPPKKQ